MARSLTLEEFDAFMRQVKWLIAGVVALFVVPLIIYGFYLDRRLTSFEDSLRYRPPEEVEEYVTNNGIYLFADRDAAEAYAAKHSDRLKQIGVKSINAKVFDLQMPLTRITRGPVTNVTHQTAREFKS